MLSVNHLTMIAYLEFLLLCGLADCICYACMVLRCFCTIDNPGEAALMMLVIFYPGIMISTRMHCFWKVYQVSEEQASEVRVCERPRATASDLHVLIIHADIVPYCSTYFTIKTSAHGSHSKC